MHVRRYSYFEGSMHLHLLPILGMGGRGPLEKRASPFLGKGRHLRTVPKCAEINQNPSQLQL